jgi:hypothetical protein
LTRSVTCTATPYGNLTTYVGFNFWCPTSAFIGNIYTIYRVGPADLPTCSSSYNNPIYTYSFCSTNNCNALPPPSPPPPPPTASGTIATRSAFALAAALAVACL